MSKLTFEDIEKTVRELAEENPDLVYDNGGYQICQYNPDKRQAGCLFGQAFIRLGEPVPSRFDAKELTSAVESAITDVMSDLGIEATPRQRSWAYHAQERQDAGIPWGEAVKSADEYVKTYYPEG